MFLNEYTTNISISNKTYLSSMKMLYSAIGFFDNVNKVCSKHHQWTKSRVLHMSMIICSTISAVSRIANGLLTQVNSRLS